MVLSGARDLDVFVNKPDVCLDQPSHSALARDLPEVGSVRRIPLPCGDMNATAIIEQTCAGKIAFSSFEGMNNRGGSTPIAG